MVATPGGILARVRLPLGAANPYAMMNVMN